MEEYLIKEVQAEISHYYYLDVSQMPLYQLIDSLRDIDRCFKAAKDFNDKTLAYGCAQCGIKYAEQIRFRAEVSEFSDELVKHLEHTLPRLSSYYRAYDQPQKALNIFDYCQQHCPSVLGHELFTSLAAAATDVNWCSGFCTFYIFALKCTGGISTPHMDKMYARARSNFGIHFEDSYVRIQDITKDIPAVSLSISEISDTLKRQDEEQRIAMEKAAEAHRIAIKEKEIKTQQSKLQIQQQRNDLIARIQTQSVFYHYSSSGKYLGEVKFINFSKQDPHLFTVRLLYNNNRAVYDFEKLFHNGTFRFEKPIDN